MLQFHTIIDLILNMCPATFSAIVVLTRISQRNWMMWRQFGLLYKYSIFRSIQQKASWLTKWMYCSKILYIVFPLLILVVCVCSSPNKDRALSQHKYTLCTERREASSGNNGLFDNLPHIFSELNFERIITESLTIVTLGEDVFSWCLPVILECC